jgi:hypothetical protein
MIVFLEIVPRWPLSSAPIRLCSAADRRVQAWDGKIWAAALSDPGALSQSLFSGDIGASIDSATGPVVLSANRLIASYPAAETVRWESASYKMWVGQFDAAIPPAFTDYVARADPHLSIAGNRIMIGGNLLTMAMTTPVGVPGLSVSQVSRGKVSRFEVQDAAIKLSLDPAGEAGDTKVLDLEYAGTTGAEGGADRKGTLKPWVFGVALNVEPVLIDEDNSVYQFSGYGPIKAVDALYERGSSFGAAVGDYADYAALVAADIPAGRWGTCLAQGMIRLGAPQYGVITGDVQGDYADGILRRKPGEILQRIAAQRSISTDTIDTDSLDALDDFAATLPAGGNINLVISDQIGFLDLARRLCAPFNAQAGYSLMGKLFACRVAVGTPTFTIHSQGKRLPVVSDFVEADTPPPFKRIVMSGNISWRVHDLANDVAFYATPKERGIYDDAETYREGDIVSIADGSRWIYVNPTATAGNDPIDGSVYWERMSGAATGPQGDSTRFIVKRSATQPATPSPSTGVPVGWYASVDDIPPDSDPVWSSFGTKLSGADEFTWDDAIQSEGTTGQAGLTISSSPPVATVARTAGGLAKSGELPKSVQVQVLDGDTDVTASCSFSKADTGCTWSNDGGGSFTLTSISAEEAYTIVTATYGSRDPVPIKISVAQPKDGSAASRATANVTSMNASGTYTAIATVDIVAAAGATISGNASTTYLAASFVGTGTRTVRQQAKVSIQNLTDGGAEVDGAAQIGTAASYVGGDGPSDVGQVSASNSVTNSSGAPKTFRLKFYIRYYDGATTAQTAGGTYSGNIEAQVA